MKTFVTKRHSEKTSKTYIVLVGEKEGKEYRLTFDRYTCMAVADLSPRDIEEMEVGDKIEV